jgi:5'-deoxynucleotidase YfbR-like HD superfamily hydrolase
MRTTPLLSCTAVDCRLVWTLRAQIAQIFRSDDSLRKARRTEHVRTRTIPPLDLQSVVASSFQRISQTSAHIALVYATLSHHSACIVVSACVKLPLPRLSQTW